MLVELSLIRWSKIWGRILGRGRDKKDIHEEKPLSGYATGNSHQNERKIVKEMWDLPKPYPNNHTFALSFWSSHNKRLVFDISTMWRQKDIMLGLQIGSSSSNFLVHTCVLYFDRESDPRQGQGKYMKKLLQDRNEIFVML